MKADFIKALAAEDTANGSTAATNSDPNPTTKGTVPGVGEGVGVPKGGGAGKIIGRAGLTLHGSGSQGKGGTVRVLDINLHSMLPLRFTPLLRLKR
jgi:hypothetical protein